MQPIQRRPLFAAQVSPELRGTPAGRFFEVVSRLDTKTANDAAARDAVALAFAALLPHSRFTTVPLAVDQPPIDGVAGSFADVAAALAGFRQGPNDPPAVFGIHSDPNAEGAPLWATGTFDGRPLLSVSNLSEALATELKFEATMLLGVDASYAAQHAAAEAQIAYAQAQLQAQQASGFSSYGFAGNPRGLNAFSGLQGGIPPPGWNAGGSPSPVLFDTSPSPVALKRPQAPEPVVPAAEPVQPVAAPVALTPAEAKARRDQVLEAARRELAARVAKLAQG